MDKFVINGGAILRGTVEVSGAKNVAMKVILAGLLTDEPLIVHNIPLISSVYGTAEIVKPLGIDVKIQKKDHTLVIRGDHISKYSVPLELGGRFRTAPMTMGPLLSRFGKAVVPNPGGCRLGKRPIDRHIEGLRSMGAVIKYDNGFFVAETKKKLHGTRFKFISNTHTGTETMILAAVLAEGETFLENSAEEPEIDDLIRLLNQMGAKIRRTEPRTIVIKGVKKLSGTEFTIMSDRNEVVTFAAAAIATGGDITIKGTDRKELRAFLEALDHANGGWEPVSNHETRFYAKKSLRSTNITTNIYPGFMTDWQAPWSVLMTQAKGESTIHETVYEDRFNYVPELRKMGANIDFFQPPISDPEKVYNFNWVDRREGWCQAIKIHGPAKLHNGVLEVSDLRAGATLIIAALIAEGESVILGVEHIERGYENIERRLQRLGAEIKRTKEEI